MVEKKDVYTRREFFKIVCGKVLPAICLTLPSYCLWGCKSSKVVEHNADGKLQRGVSPTSCNNGCQASCNSLCRVGCGVSAKGSCEGCHGACVGTCRTSCNYNCQSTCKEMCHSSCRGSK